MPLRFHLKRIVMVKTRVGGIGILMASESEMVVSTSIPRTPKTSQQHCSTLAVQYKAALAQANPTSDELCSARLCALGETMLICAISSGSAAAMGNFTSALTSSPSSARLLSRRPVPLPPAILASQEMSLPMASPPYSSSSSTSLVQTSFSSETSRSRLMKKLNVPTKWQPRFVPWHSACLTM